MEFTPIESSSDTTEIRELFLEYARSLNFKFCFDSFDQEVSALPGEYAPPHGRLVLCRVKGAAAGCIALKRLQSDSCEMKRLYVRPEFRGRELGRALVNHLIGEARTVGYKFMRLDTIPESMPHAVALYRSFGFREIPPYDASPVRGAMAMQLDLK